MIEELALIQLSRTNEMVAWLLGTFIYIAFVFKYIKKNTIGEWSLHEDGIFIALAFVSWILGGAFSFVGIYVCEGICKSVIGNYTFQPLDPFMQKCIEIAGKTLTQTSLAWTSMKIYKYGIYPNLKG